jgi:HSP20 family protein
MATLQRWDPFRDLATLHQDVNRLFNQTWGGSTELQAGAWAPQMDVYETADTFVVELDLPGMDPDSIDLTLDQNLLTIRGERTFSGKVEQDK